MRGPIRGPLLRNPVGSKRKRPSRPSAAAGSGGPTGRLGMGGMSNRATNRRAQIIEEDEYIGEVNGSVGFVTTQYSCNPGQAAVFPWGNRIASLYERYDFESLEFYYKREVSEFAANGVTGKVMLSFDYDASDGPPTTKQVVEDSVPHADGMPCTSIIRLPIDCRVARAADGKFVRPGAQPANTDLKTYDIGNLFVSTQGCASTAVVGELHVRYRVRLFEPVLDASTLAGGAVHFSSIAATTADNFAASALQAGYTPALGGITAATNIITFPSGIPGNYVAVLTVAGATSATALGGFTLSGGATQLRLLSQSAVRNAASQVASLAGTTVSPACVVCSFTVATGGGLLTLTPSTIVGTGTMDLLIFSLPSSLLTATQGVGELSTELEELRDQVAEMRSWYLGTSAGQSASCRPASLSLSEDEGDYDSKSPELDSSVHISRSMAARLMKAVGASK